MHRMSIAVISGVLEGLLLCAGIFVRNPLALALAVVFFVLQWRHFGTEGKDKSLRKRVATSSAAEVTITEEHNNC